MRIEPTISHSLVAAPVRFGDRIASALPSGLYTASSIELSGLPVRDANMRNSQRARKACAPPPMRDTSKLVASLRWLEGELRLCGRVRRFPRVAGFVEVRA